MSEGYRQLAAGLVKQLESCRLKGYADTGGVPTIGYGHTGPNIMVGEQISQASANTFLDSDLRVAERRLRSVLSKDAMGALKDHQLAALLSFVFNLGANSGWTIWKVINAGNLDAVPEQLRRFNKGRVNGKLVTIKGLANRREAEIAFWNTADEAGVAAAARPDGPGSGVDQAPPSSVTVAMPTPPTPTPAPPLAKTSLAAKIVTTAGGVTAAAASQSQQIHDVIAPHADSAHIFYVLDMVAIGVVIAAGIVGLYIHAHQASVRET